MGYCTAFFRGEAAGRELIYNRDMLKVRMLSVIVMVVLLVGRSSPAASDLSPLDALPALQPGEVRFAVTSDMRYFTSAAGDFPAAAQAIAQLGGIQFMITPGDMDPPDAVRKALDDALGKDFAWYPVIGNHELPGQGQEAAPGANLAWLRGWQTVYGYPLVRSGPTPCPETTYSFDIPPLHFAAINEYCSAEGDAVTDGDISDVIYNWLAQDLALTSQPHKIVIGHEPAFPQPDADLGGAARHLGDSLDQYPANRDRFWALLTQHGVTAYLTGHTHLFSAIRRDGVWQIDAGHARGAGDLSAPSTFLVVSATTQAITMKVYRGISSYQLRHQVVLEGWEFFLPQIVR